MSVEAFKPLIKRVGQKGASRAIRAAHMIVAILHDAISTAHIDGHIYTLGHVQCTRDHSLLPSP